jgi:uncharacterized membrane protein YgdD (TMEM256/DUF423 family)
MVWMDAPFGASRTSSSVDDGRCLMARRAEAGHLVGDDDADDFRTRVMNRTFWILGCAMALMAVGAGAFGAHALRARLSPDMLAVWETAARYQMYHALALLAVALALPRASGGSWNAAGWLFTAGIILFSGSLYVLALSGIRWLGAVTPLGGVCFLAGWALLALAGLRMVSR